MTMTYKYCPNCRAANEMEAGFCGSCGAPLPNTQQVAAAAQPAYSPNQTQAYPITGGPQSFPPQAPGYQAAPQSFPPQAPGYQQAPQSFPPQAPGYQAAPQSFPPQAPGYQQAPQSFPPQYQPQVGPGMMSPANAQALAAAQAAGMILPPGTAPAGFGIRFLAFLLDGVILAIVTYVLPASLRALANYLLGPIYMIVMWATMGRTLGKLAVGLTVVSVDGQPMSWGKAIVRYLGYLVSAIMIGIGFLAISFDGAKRGVHDRIAKTVVVRKA